MSDTANKASDKFFFSPDVGFLVQRSDSLYTQDGTVLSSNVFVRKVPINAEGHENYADWTEEHRCEVREAFVRQVQLEKIKETARLSRRDALVKQARLKLTAEEFDAVFEQGVACGRE